MTPQPTLFKGPGGAPTAIVAGVDVELPAPPHPFVSLPPKWREVVAFFVPGIPRPGGSKTAQAIYRGGKPVMANGRVLVTVRDASKHAPDWKRTVATFAAQAFDGPLLTGPLRVEFAFRMPRPKGHFGTGRNAGAIKATAPTYHTGKPDVLKLSRSTEDALTGIVWADDALIADERIVKVYATDETGGRPGAWVRVAVLTTDGGRA